ncbi:MAG: hypothetical protein AAF799_42565 [Myxococcota bacterium]
MGWTADGRASLSWDSRRPATGPLRRVEPQALRGATTLENVTLPALIVTCFVALATIQLILTW